uniref:Sushi domain-containing protein n=1 Tax=Vombatus ursinus TaxID=29139 RepID=A0A4X2L8F8_VOMUR
MKRGLLKNTSRVTCFQGNLSVSLEAQCPRLLPPPFGFYNLEKGSGCSPGSVVVFSCQVGYQLIGSRTMICLLGDNGTIWSHPEPQCEEGIPKSPNHGSQGAVTVSLISGAIIFTVCISFIICCLREKGLRSSSMTTQAMYHQGRMSNIGRRVDSTDQVPQRHKGADGKDQRQRESLPTQLSPIDPGTLTICDNWGFQRSQESLPWATVQTLGSEVPVFTPVVLQQGALSPPPTYIYLLQ